ncbi:MAG: helix-turn-helix transcriptional regulator [Anaerolineae bacterium]|nr:helix-turn-helix transcriptional regulator [Anaerolineae bacterium]
MSLLGDRVKVARIAKDWGIRQLAQMSGVEPSAISRIESGESLYPTAQTIANLAQVLNVSSDYLLGLVESPDEHGAVFALSSEAWEGARLIESLPDEESRRRVVEALKLLLEGVK